MVRPLLLALRYDRSAALALTDVAARFDDFCCRRGHAVGSHSHYSADQSRRTVSPQAGQPKPSRIGRRETGEAVFPLCPCTGSIQNEGPHYPFGRSSNKAATPRILKGAIWASLTSADRKLAGRRGRLGRRALTGGRRGAATSSIGLTVRPPPRRSCGPHGIIARHASPTMRNRVNAAVNGDA